MPPSVSPPPNLSGAFWERVQVTRPWGLGSVVAVAAGRGCPQGWGAPGPGTRQTSAVPPAPASPSLAPPAAGASLPPVDPVPPSPGAVPVPVVMSVPVGPSFHGDILLVHCLLLCLRLR